MNPYAGSFEINQQYQWHFTTFSIELPATWILKNIYGAILKAHLETDPKFSHLRKLADAFITTMMDIHNKVVFDFPPTAIKFHYSFNMRDLTNVLQGIMNVRAEYIKTPAIFV